MADGDLKAAHLHLASHLDAQPTDAGARRLAGELAMRMGNYDLAITEFKQLSALPGKEAEGRDRLADAFLANGNTRMAKRTLSQGEIASPLAYDVTVGVALIEGRDRQALQTLAEGLEKFPESAELHALDAHLALQSGNLESAKSKLAKARSLDPGLVDVNLLAGRIALLEKDLGLAKTSFENVLQHQPNHQTAILAMIAVATDTGDDAGRDKWLARASDSGKANPIAVYFAAQSAFESNDVKRAFELIQPITGTGKTFPALDRLTGLIAARRGQTNDAIVNLERYFADGGEDRVARLVLAAEQHRNKEHSDAWTTIQPLISSDTANPRALELGIDIARALGKSEGRALEAKLAGAGPDNDFVSAMARAGTAIRKGDWKSADAIYSRLLGEGNRDQVGLLNNAAQARLALGQKQSAVSLAREAHALAPNDAVVLDTLGWVLFKTGGASEEARALLASAAARKPADRQIAKHLGAVNASLSTN